jgi:hypothetical protein
MRAAQHAASADTRITLWAELAVLAHLTGWTMPMPGPAFAAALAALDARTRDCALSHAADNAAAARAPAITARISPPRLAAHVTAAMRAAADTGEYLCDRQEPGWLAPAWQWIHILDSLQARHDADPAAGPDPGTRAWEAGTGRAIPGFTCASQLAAVRAWHDRAQRDLRAMRAITWGARTPAAITAAVGADPGSGGWDTRLGEALAEFRDCRWPADYLRPPRPIP